MFIWRTNAEAENPIPWPSDAKSWLIWNVPDAGKDWSWEEKGVTDEEMVGWHHQFNGHEFKQAPGVGDGQGSLECCRSWGHKESDMTKRLNWTDPQRGEPNFLYWTASGSAAWQACGFLKDRLERHLLALWPWDSHQLLNLSRFLIHNMAIV